jgi:hypothetical protein
MRRRLFLLAMAALAPADAAARQAIDVFTAMASALSEGDAAGFMRLFDRQMPGVNALAANVEALLAQAEVQSSISFLSDEGDEARRSVEVEWAMQIREKREAGRVVRRRQTVKCRLERQGRRWVVAAFEPAAFFAPPRME